MIDYYKELELDKALSTVDINTQLSKLERIWIRREVNNPEKAAKKLLLIHEAREVFKTDESRRQYDRKLTGEDKRDEQRSREEQFRLEMEKSKDKATNFFNTEQYDLAFITINDALSYMSALSLEDASILSLAADIYRCNGESETAKGLINRAIMMDPENCMYYLIKAQVVGSLGEVQGKQNSLDNALSLANKSNNRQNKANILGVYARVLYFEYPQDKEKAKQYAQEALSLGETWGNAQKVLKKVNDEEIQQKKQKDEADKIEREKAAEAARLEAQRLAEEAAQRKAEEDKKRREAEYTNNVNHWNKLYILSIVLFVSYTLCPSIMFLIREPNILIVLLALSYYTGTSSLMCMSAAVRNESWPIGQFIICLFCFGPASLVNAGGGYPIPLGGFMIVWAIIVIASGYYGKQIKYNL